MGRFKRHVRIFVGTFQTTPEFYMLTYLYLYMTSSQSSEELIAMKFQNHLYLVMELMIIIYLLVSSLNEL